MATEATIYYWEDAISGKATNPYSGRESIYTTFKDTNKSANLSDLPN